MKHTQTHNIHTYTYGYRDERIEKNRIVASMLYRALRNIERTCIEQGVRIYEEPTIMTRHDGGRKPSMDIVHRS